MSALVTAALAAALAAPTAVGPFPDGHAVSVLMRWAHIVSVSLLVGGLGLFYALCDDPLLAPPPAGKGKQEAPERPWIGAARSMFSRATLASILTGAYFAVRDFPSHKGDRVFHSLFGTKMILALVVFFFAAATAGRARCLRFVRANRARFLRVALFAAAAATLVAGMIRAHKQLRA